MMPELSTTVGLSVKIIGTLPKRAYTAYKLPIPLYIYRQTDTCQVVATFQVVEHQKSVGTGHRQTDAFHRLFAKRRWNCQRRLTGYRQSTPATRFSGRLSVEGGSPGSLGLLADQRAAKTMAEDEPQSHDCGPPDDHAHQFNEDHDPLNGCARD